jgi:hypothetical protein
MFARVEARCYRRAVGTWLAAPLLGLVFAAAAQAGSQPSPCSLVTSAQVKAAFGGTVGAGKVDNSIPGSPTCHFTVTHSNLGFNGTAVVFLTPEQTVATFKLARKEVPGAVNASGVGTAAFYNPHTAGVELLKGSTVANAQGIFLNPGGPQPNAAKLKADVIALAKAVAAHL